MKLKLIVIAVLIILSHVSRGNMASPIREGSYAASAFSSKDVDILSESILIQIDADFKTARYIIEYTIRSDSAGKQIPLLFYAMDYKDGFSVWLDDEQVEIKNDFSFNPEYFWGTANQGNDVTVYWNENYGTVCRLKDLKYFEAGIGKGIHTIRVEYIASAWADMSGWITQFSFRYSLTPAKYWRSFGKLDITVEQKNPSGKISSNLGLPRQKQTEAKNTWSFNAIPVEYIKLEQTPDHGILANILMTIGPLGICVFATVLLIAIHWYFTKLYRRKYLVKDVSVVVVLGSLLVPFLSLLMYMYAFELIDYSIGENAGRRHGYTFLVFIFYPLYWWLYWFAFWLMDRTFKARLKQKINDGIEG